jgi:hypothetical protein
MSTQTPAADVPPRAGALVMLTPGALYRELQAEFCRLRPESCMSCRVPLPVRLEDHAEGDCNWRLEMVSTCDDGCDATITGIAAEAATRFRMAGPA